MRISLKRRASVVVVAVVGMTAKVAVVVTTAKAAVVTFVTMTVVMVIVAMAVTVVSFVTMTVVVVMVVPVAVIGVGVWRIVVSGTSPPHHVVLMVLVRRPVAEPCGA